MQEAEFHTVEAELSIKRRHSFIQLRQSYSGGRVITKEEAEFIQWRQSYQLGGGTIFYS
jgi:hypothetical protein